MSLKIHYGIYQSKQAYCYLSQTGSVYSWGSDSYGGYSLHLAKDIWKNKKDMRLNKEITIYIKTLDGKTVSKSLRFSN